MSSECKIILIGYLGKDPEVQYTQNGTAKCVFSVATSKRWKTNAGEQQEKTIWHRVIVWGKQGENCGKYLAKGGRVYIDGELDRVEWDDKQTGEKKSMYEVIGHRVVFLSTRSENQPQGSQGQQQDKDTPNKPKGNQGQSESYGYEPGMGDDIPF